MDSGVDPIAARVAALEEKVAELERRLAKPSAFPPARAPAPSSAPRLPPAAPTVRRPDLETLIAGRWLNRIGLIALALGVAYFLKLAIDNEWMGPREQVALGLVAGTALLASIPWFLRKSSPYFADGIAGLGGATLYLSLWAGGSYYHVFSLSLTFAIMIAVTAVMIAIAVARRSQTVAVLAMLGGFASPALVSTGQDAQLTLFSYLFALDAGLLLLAWSRGWRLLAIPSLVLTHAYLWGWYVNFYSARRQFDTSAFAVAFFAMFLALSTRLARRTGKTPFDQMVLVPLNAGATLALFSAMLLPNRLWALTFVALGLAAIHALVARVMKDQSRLIYGGVALTAATLVIPIRLNGPWITLAWSVEGAVLMWTGFTSQLPSMRGLAYFLFLIAVLRIVETPPLRFSLAVLNGRFFAEVVTVGCFGFALWIGRKHRDAITQLEKMGLETLSVAVNLIAVWALTEELRLYFRTSFSATDTLAEGLAVSLLWTLYASGLMVLGIRWTLAGVRWQALALFALTTLKVFFNDMAQLNGFYRVASSIALGIVLLAVSFIYQRNLRTE